MKHIRCLFLSIFALFLGIFSVDALDNVCSTSTKKQLATEAAYVKVDYEIKDNSEIKTLTIGDSSTTYKVPNYSFEISIYNLSENLSATIATTNEGEKKFLNVNYTDTVDGVYTFVDTNVSDIYNYKITIISNNQECQGMTIRTMKFTKPRYNAYSEYTYCKNSSNYYCQRFIGTEINIEDTDDFLSRIKVNNEKSNPNRDKIDEEKEIKDLVKENWKLYLIILFGTVTVFSIIFILVKKHKKKKGWRL